MTKITIRSAEDWDEVYRTAVAAGRTFSGRKPEGTFFPARTVSAPTLPLENTFVLYEGETLVSALQVYERRMTVGGVPVPVAALGNVFTVPERQGEGHGSRLLDNVRERLSDRGYAASVLLTETPAFYEQHGWKPVPYDTLVCPDPSPVANRSGERWKPFDVNDHLDTVRVIYRDTHRSREGRLLRTEAFWRRWIFGAETEVLSPEQVRLYSPDGTVEGYVVVADGKRPTCHEVGYVGDDPEAFLLDAWNDLCDRTDRPVAWIPPQIECVRDELEASGCTFEERNESQYLLQAHSPKLLSSACGKRITETADLRRQLTSKDWYWSPVDSF